MFKKLIFGLLILLMCSCDSFTGCGTVVCIGVPQPQYDYYEQVKIPNGKYYYPIYIKDKNGETHQVYVSSYTWLNAQEGDIICVE